MVQGSMKAPHMAKDRNTMAKRQREAEKRDKAVKKRQKREKRQTLSTLSSNGIEITEDETRVFQIFSRYLMTAGKMLCLSGNELDAHRQSLNNLVSSGMLVAETFQGGYSLTEEGFDAMRKLANESRT